MSKPRLKRRALLQGLPALAAALWLAPGAARAQDSVPVYALVEALQRDPRYAGRLLGARSITYRGRPAYEVRIARRDGALIVLILDGRTGEVLAGHRDN